MPRSLARLFYHRAFLVTVGLLTCYSLYAAWSGWSASHKLTADEVDRARALSKDAGEIHLKVELRVDPEQIHFLVFQEHGRMVGVEGRVISMRNVPLDKVGGVVRPYWIADVVPWDGG